MRVSGAYRNRTDDLLTAREISSVTYPMKISYIKNTQDSQKVIKSCKRTLEKDAVFTLI
jgi:hypothetical protein